MKKQMKKKLILEDENFRLNNKPNENQQTNKKRIFVQKPKQFYKFANLKLCNTYISTSNDLYEKRYEFVDFMDSMNIAIEKKSKLSIDYCFKCFRNHNLCKKVLYLAERKYNSNDDLHKNIYALPSLTAKVNKYLFATGLKQDIVRNTKIHPLNDTFTININPIRFVNERIESYSNSLNYHEQKQNSLEQKFYIDNQNSHKLHAKNTEEHEIALLLCKMKQNN